MKTANSVLTTFIRRISNLGIHVELMGNIPLVYIKSVNNIRVKEKFNAVHGFTAFYYPTITGADFEFTDRRKVFNLVRNYAIRSLPVPDTYERRKYRKDR